MNYFGPGAHVVGELTDSADTKTYTVYLNAGQNYDIYVGGGYHQNGNTDFQPGYVADPDVTISGFGQVVSNDDADGVNAAVYFTPSVSGNYTVTVGSNSGFGKFDLVVTNKSYQVDILDHGGNVVGVNTSLNIGDTLVSTIMTKDDVDYVRVYLQAGTEYTFSARGADTGDGTLADPRIHISSSFEGQWGIGDDDSGVGKNAERVFTPINTGVYYVRVDGFGSNTGSYELQVTAAGSHDASNDPFGVDVSTVPMGGAVQSAIGFAGDKDFYAVELTAGATYQFDLTSAANGGAALTDPYLELANQFGTIFTQNDDGGPGSDGQLVFTATQSGVHYLAASGFENSTGNFTLSAKLLSLPPTPVVTLTSNSSVGEEMMGSADADYLTGGSAADVIDGGMGSDWLSGGNGNDTMVGGDGSDWLNGNAGKDWMSGDAGGDRFDFNTVAESKKGATRDVIADFDRAEGDKVDLSTIDADTDGTAGNNAFKFIGTQAFHKVDGELRFANGLLQGDTNGDGIADIEVSIVGHSSLIASDFVL